MRNTSFLTSAGFTFAIRPFLFTAQPVMTMPNQQGGYGSTHILGADRAPHMRDRLEMSAGQVGEQYVRYSSTLQTP